MREQGSRSLPITHLTVKSFFIEFKFHGPLETWRQNSQGCFWTNECLQMVFLTDSLFFFSENLKNLWLMQFGPVLEKQQQVF